MTENEEQKKYSRVKKLSDNPNFLHDLRQFA